MSDDKKIIFSMVNVSKIYPPQKQVLKNIYLSFFYGAKIGVLGLNGAGKSSLLKIIAGLDTEYQGEVVFSPGYSVGYLPQEPQMDDSLTVKEVVMQGVQEVVDILKEYEEVNMKFMEPMSDDEMNKLIERQGELTESFTVTAFSFLASRQNRFFPGFLTTVVLLLHGLSLSSITFNSSMLSISAYTISCTAGDIG